MHHLPPPLGSSRQRQGFLLRDGQTNQRYHLVLHLPVLFPVAAQRTGSGHAPQQQLHIVAQSLTQLVRGHCSVLQKAAYRRLLSRRLLRLAHQRPRLPVVIPHRRGKHRPQRIVERAEIPPRHPQRQPQLLFREDRLLVQQRAHRLQRLVRHLLPQGQDHRLAEAVSPSEGHQHTAAHLPRQLRRQQVVIDLVDGISRRLHGDLGDCGHISPRYPLPR